MKRRPSRRRREHRLRGCETSVEATSGKMSDLDAASVQSSVLQSLVEEYLRVLMNERGASVHTLRAYGRELCGFAAWSAERFGQERGPDKIEHTDIRAYLGAFTSEGLRRLQRRGRWRRFGVGSNGWRVQDMWIRTWPRWWQRRDCPSICRACHRLSRWRGGGFGERRTRRAGRRAMRRFSSCCMVAESATRS